MTEQTLEAGTQNQSENGSIPSNEALATTEKLLPQSEVNKMVSGAKMASYERAKQEVKADYEAKIQALQQHSQVSSSSENQLHSTKTQAVQNYTPEQIEQLIDERTTKKFEEREQNAYQQEAIAQYQKEAQHFIDKISRDSKKYPDFDETVKQLELGKTIESDPSLLNLYNSVDNPVDVLYDLAKHPHKAAQLELLFKSGRTQAAISQLKSLSQSIVQNQTVQHTPQANAPLSQLKTSSLGTDNGKLKMPQLKRKFTA